MSLVARLLRRRADPREPLRPLYAAVVAQARAPRWYRDGRVPDTLDGRFDMLAAVLSLVLLRLEDDGAPTRAPSAHLAELFIEDMDGQLRERGIGDIVVGKHVGRMMGALGGRIDAFRDALGLGDLTAAVRRNLYRAEATAPVAGEQLVIEDLRTLHARLAATPTARLLAGELPR